MADRAQLLVWLSEAENALHQLNMGLQAKEFHDQNGEKVIYNAATRGQLVAYIADLKRQLGIGGAIIGPSTLVI